jgi:hypothetical protein
MEEIAKLLQAIAALLWPIFAFAVLATFRPQIKDLLGRLRRGKLLGQEIELGDSLSELERSAVAAQSEVAALPPAATADSGSLAEEGKRANVASERMKNETEVIDRVLNLTAQSPKAALLVLAAEVEREVRRLMASLGLLTGRQSVPIHRAIEELDRYGLPKHVPSSLRLFWEVRNRLVHGHQASDADTLSAIDSGIAILRALHAIPHEENIVFHPGVPIYSEPTCKTLIPNVKGVILETTSPGGASQFYRIFPTTRTHFAKGRRVSWEWSDEHVFGNAWYIDPNTGTKREAWSSSMEFVGRNLDEV